jgi:hypothetical protein
LGVIVGLWDGFEQKIREGELEREGEFNHGRHGNHGRGLGFCGGGY